MPIPEDTKQQIQDILEKSSLSAEDRALWHERLESISDTYSYMFFDLFSEDMSGLPKATERMKEKIAAIKANDPGKVAEIIREEYDELVEAAKE